MFNYVECGRTVSTATWDSLPIEGDGDIRVELLSAVRAVRVVMENVPHVSTFNHNRFSVGAAAGEGHSVVFDKEVCTLQLKSGTSVCFPKFGSLFFIQDFPLPPPELAFAVTAPRLTPTTLPVGINAYHCVHGHIHEALLRKTAEQTGVILEGTLHECKGRSMAKGLRKPISRSIHILADKNFGRVFVDLSGPKPVESKGRNRYVMIVKDDYPRFMWVYSMRHKSDAPETFRRF